ncbi:MAG: hypothetical protein Q9166_007892 [cf. Caloplaca sp. 2 TL-2023]
MPVSIEVDIVMRDLLEREDIDQDKLITIDDQGPKVCLLADRRSLLVNKTQDFPLGKFGKQRDLTFDVQGVYQLSNLLQELFLAREQGLTTTTIKRSQLEEDPVHRLSRLITTSWWDNLTRRIDADGIELATPDPKLKSSVRIYVPPGVPEQFAYYSDVAKEYPAMNLDVQWLPKDEVTAEYIKSINSKPGILALDMEGIQLAGQPNTKQLKGLPFIVPGDQFNELYNWDACFCALGMLDNHLPVVKGIVKNFIFEIKHYGKILNANRSYYLGRAQPPLLTWLALRTYHRTKHEPDALDILRSAILAARKEYHEWWTSLTRLDEESGLSRHRPRLDFSVDKHKVGKGLPPECRLISFAHVFLPYTKKYGMTLQEMSDAYNDETITEPDLDTFFDHDRAVRESGHDTSNRVEDLNCLLYQIENDIASVIQTHFGDSLITPEAFCVPGEKADMVESSGIWRERAEERKDLVDKYLWNEEKGLYYDYNTVIKRESTAESITSLWPLWCGAANHQQAAWLVEDGLPMFECIGGLSSTSESTRGTVSEANPQKQWDYPDGWAPHQVLAWDGLRNYGYHDEADRLAYRWLHMMTETFRNWNGTVCEKYNVTQLERSHYVDAEYGN